MFSSQGDAEVLLNGLIHEGVGFLEHLDGMFAFAFYDIKNDHFILSRDSYGEKPLYIYENNDIYIFSSEIQAIIESGFYTKEIELKALYNYFRRGYFVGDDCIYKGIKKLIPGNYMEIKNFGRHSISHTYKSQLYQMHFDNNNGYKKYIKDTLISACERRFRADTDIGMLLSGGVDSTLLSCIAKLELGINLDSFTVGYRDITFDESINAKNISNMLGINNQCFMLDNEDIFEITSELPSIYTEPFADTSSISTAFLAKNVSKIKKVVMGGDGADEVFGGYLHNYRISTMHSKLKDSYYRKLKIFKNKYISNTIVELANKFGFPRNSDSYREYYSKLSAFGLDDLYDVETAIWFKEECNLLMYDDLLKENNFNNFNNFNNINDILNYEMNEFLPNNIFYKCDRAFMHYGIENRTPFTDVRLMQMRSHFNSPVSLNNPKDVLKSILFDYMPKYDFNRKKRGFSIPIDTSLRDVLHPFLKYFFSDEYLSKVNFLNAIYLKHIYNLFNKGKIGYASKVFAYLSFAIWYEKNFLTHEKNITSLPC